MKAIRIHAKEDIRIEDVQEPIIEPGKVLLKGGYTGICGSDVHLYYAPEMFVHWDFSKPAKLTGAKWPQILGHEFSGVVSAVGEGVDNVKVGDKVTVFPYHYCGECPACLSGDTTWCPNLAFEGIQGRSGGMAEVSIVDASDCFVLPATLDLRHGAIVEPMAVAWRGVSLANPDPQKAALVIGAGPIGLGAFFALKAKGVSNIIVSEPSASRREILRKNGAVNVIDPVAENLTEQVMQLTQGMGADVAIDCAGVPAAFLDALNCLGLYGRMMIVAAYSGPIDLMPHLLAGGKTIHLSATYTKQDFAEVIEAMDRQIYQTDGWVDIIDFEQVEKTIHELHQGQHMKVLVASPE
jgi:(R,R)-butanediol dehydrogenase/meso-butanediol dehydrogenase/diacetyl reductase